MRGVIMAGGSGTRLHPLTIAVNKHLIPIYNKPLIYYPISTLMLAGIREICIVVNPEYLSQFETLLGDGSNFGIKICFEVQEKPEGIAQGLLLAKEFIRDEKIGFILGDNIFHGVGLGRKLMDFVNIEGAHGFAYQVKDPSRYGVVELDSMDRVMSLEEKPEIPRSNYALTGLYFYDEKVLNLVEGITASNRGELEITDLNEKYLRLGEFNVTKLSRGTAWLDTGTFESLHDASSYIKLMEDRQLTEIGNPIEVARQQGWVK
jgi:glucose-1-phosphate thymidylyltransferase